MGIVVKGCAFAIRYTLMNWFFWALAGIVASIKFYLIWTRSFLICPGRINGKTVVVTGANTGLGFEISRILASRGARLIMACRNMGSAYQAKAAIIHLTGNSNIEIRQIDLSSLWSVRQFAKGITETEDRVDILIHCAGVMGVKDCKTNDDLQISWQINHFSPFLLTHLLLDLMRRSASGRVIFMSSMMHHFSHLHSNLDRINDDNVYSQFRSYSDISLANILVANMFAQKLKNTGITVNVVNPGFVNVHFRRIKNSVLQMCLASFLSFFAKTLEEGSATAVMVAVKPDLEEVTGQYFAECRVSGCLSKHTKDIKLAEKLWKKNEELVGMEDYEKLY